MFGVALTRVDGECLYTGLTLSPVRYTHSARGGPDAAEIAVTGDKNALSDVLNWLACKVVIYNDGGHPVWWDVAA